MTSDIVFFIAGAAAMIGQFMDVRTTEVALTHGFVEANKLGAWLIKKIGIGFVYPLKVAVLPFAGALCYMGISYLGIGVEVFLAVYGGIYGVKNYLKLKAAKIAVF